MALSAELGEAKDLYPQIFAALRQAFGVDFTYYKFNTIGRRIARRMTLRHVDRLEEYVALLHDDPAELEALFQDVLIMVTEFFREPETFAALRSAGVPQPSSRAAPRPGVARLGAGLCQRRGGLQPGDGPR